MKCIFIFLLVLFTLPAIGQTTTTKLPKLIMTEGFWSTKYDLGEQRMPQKAIELHLNKNQPITREAYSLWRKAKAQNTAAWLWTVVMISGGTSMLVSVAKGHSFSEAVPLIGAGTMLLGGTCGVISASNATNNFQRSVEAYNKAAGY